jgi:glucosamine kinase
MALFLGIDGGGTKTTCCVGDDSAVLATATGSGSNVIRLGEAQAKIGLQSAISQACSAAGVSPLRIQSACIGAAGATNPDTNAATKQMARQILPNAEIVVVGDMVIAHEAALSGHSGVVAIAGTGSIAYGRNDRGETSRAGGWGFAISDEGSGQWIGRAAVTSAMRAFDSGQPSVLLKGILEQWRLSSTDDLIRTANSTPPPNFAELFPVVQNAVEQGDTIADEILSRAGAELVNLVFIVMRKLWTPGEQIRIGVAGGVFANSTHVRRSFYHSLQAAWPKSSICFQITDPVLGALSMARRSVAAAGAR